VSASTECLAHSAQKGACARVVATELDIEKRCRITTRNGIQCLDLSRERCMELTARRRAELRDLREQPEQLMKAPQEEERLVAEVCRSRRECARRALASAVTESYVAQPRHPRVMSSVWMAQRCPPLSGKVSPWRMAQADDAFRVLLIRLDARADAVLTQRPSFGRAQVSMRPSRASTPRARRSSSPYPVSKVTRTWSITPWPRLPCVEVAAARVASICGRQRSPSS
jgi:hypothetical protein